MNVQYKKGVLTLCVMALSMNKDHYGYELVKNISEKFLIAEGTIYPLLRRLTKEGYFSTYLVESQEGPPRKYYKLTELGRNHVLELIDDWKNFSKSVDLIIGEGIKNEAN
ncbi:PadR family transcriptional regulator [Cytobacillus sp. NJ13]|nr:PadR family transcriptional regulator [Cytobacillus sp. NJ13]